ncbi:hypothetical protein Tco_1289875 [Tanacetum coccineum]
MMWSWVPMVKLQFWPAKKATLVDSYWNVDSSSPSTTPIIEKIDKIEKLIIDGKVTLVDDEGNRLEKVDYSGDYDSEDESLLEQWKESYENDDYEYDPYDDDMYEGLL